MPTTPKEPNEELDGTQRFERPTLDSEFKARQIVNAAGSILHVDPRRILSEANGEVTVTARWAVIFLLKEILDPSFPWMGRFLHVHHTTAMRDLSQARAVVARGGAFAEKVMLIRAAYLNMPGDHFIVIPQPVASWEKILSVVAYAFLMANPDDIYTESNLRAIVFPRQIATYLGHTIGELSLQNIARKFTQDDTSALYSYRQIKAAAGTDPWLRFLLEELATRCLWDDGIPTS